MSAGLFVAIAAVLCAAAALAVLGTAQVHLSGPAAIEHDGLAPGRPAPRWSLPDAAGVAIQRSLSPIATSVMVSPAASWISVVRNGAHSISGIAAPSRPSGARAFCSSSCLSSSNCCRRALRARSICCYTSSR